MLTAPVLAQAAGGAPDLISSLLPIVMIFVIFFFLVIRPQQKKQKEHLTLLAGLRRGDVVVTGGGIIGKVIKVPNEGDELQVEIADNVRVKVLRATISQVVSRTEPAKGDDGEK